MGARLRACVIRSLWAGALLLLSLGATSAVWGLLAALGDSTGARVAKGISLGLGVCWGLNLVVLVVLSAVAQLNSRDEPAESAAEPQD